MDEQTKTFLSGINAEWWPCGSRVTCNPPPMDTDADFLVCIPSKAAPVVMSGLNTLGYSWEGSAEHYQFQLDDGFSSFRKDAVNLIVSANPTFVEKHKVATGICRGLNLMDKKNRILVFQAVLYGKLPS